MIKLKQAKIFRISKNTVKLTNPNLVLDLAEIVIAV